MKDWMQFRGREEELERMVDAWNQAQSGCPQCVVTLADSGYGKTRMIHEFFRQISEQENSHNEGNGYWPDELDKDPTKLDINPDFSGFQSQGQIPWLWWGIRWENPDDRNQKNSSTCGLTDFRDHLDRHVKALIDRREHANTARKAGKTMAKATAELVMDFMPLPNLMGIANSSNDLWKSISNTWKSNKEKEKLYDETKQVENRVHQAIEFLRAYLDPEVENAETIPVILVLDDAQWADPMTIKFACDLLCRAHEKQWPLMLLVTHWETEWKSAPAGKVLTTDNKANEWESFRDFEATIRQRSGGSDALKIIPVGKLEENHIRKIVTSAFPGLEQEYIDTILERCDGNMLICEEFIKILEEESTWFVDHDQTKSLDEDYREDFYDVTNTAEKRADKRINSILKDNKSLAEFLRLGAVQGITFYHSLLSEVAERLEKGDHDEWANKNASEGEKFYAILSNHGAPPSSSEFRHRLYRECMIKRMKKEWPTYRNALREVLNEWWENPEASDGEWSLSQLMLYAALLGEDAGGDLLQQAIVYHRISQHLSQQGKWRERLEWTSKAYECIKDHESEEAIDIINDHVVSLRDMGHYDQALAPAQSVLETSERALGREHPSTLVSVSNLASLLESKGEYEEANSLYCRTLEASERTLGPKHPSTLISVNNLASLLEFKGDYEVAKILFRRAMETSEQSLGHEHPNTLTSMNNLAGLLRSKGEYEEAKSLYCRTLEASERTLGFEHPFTLSCVNDLAGLLRSKGEYEEAKSLFRRALETSKRTLGPEHPDTLTYTSNLAGLLQSNGDYEEAKSLFRRALETSKRTLGPEHPDTLTYTSNLAGLLQSKGDYKQAEPLYCRALEGSERVLGSDHPDTAVHKFALWKCRHQMGKTEIPVGELQEAYQLFAKKKGSAHSLAIEAKEFIDELHNDASK